MTKENIYTKSKISKVHNNLIKNHLKGRYK